MSAPSRRSVSGGSSRRSSSSEFGGTTLRSTSDHGDDDGPPPPPGRRGFGTTTSSSNASGSRTASSAEEGWEHHMSPEERRRLRESGRDFSLEDSIARGAAAAASASGAPVGRSTGSYAAARHEQEEDKYGVPASPKQQNDTAASFTTPTITPGRGIPEESSVRYGNREHSTTTGETASRATHKTSNRRERHKSLKEDDIMTPPPTESSAERRERRRELRSRDELMTSSQSSADRKERRSSKSSKYDEHLTPRSRERKVRRERESSGDVQSPSSSSRIRDKKERRTSSAKSTDEAPLTPRSKERRRKSNRGELLAPSESLDRRDRRRREKESAESKPKSRREKIDALSSSRKSSRDKALDRKEHARRSKTRASFTSNSLSEEGRPSQREYHSEEFRMASEESEEYRPPRTDSDRVGERKKIRDSAARSESKRSSSTSEPSPRTSSHKESSPASSAQISARNRLRERMLGDLDNSSGSSRDRVKAILSLDTPKARRKSEMPPVAEKEVVEVPVEPVSPPKVSRSLEETTAVVASTSSSEEEELIEIESEESTESSDGDSDEENWSVRVSVLSAVDLPTSVVPNIPLCPVLKFGLVTIPATEGSELDSDSMNTRSSVLAEMEKSGLTALPKARVRCTSTKILAKRDAGAVEFNEEMRWDKVKRPQRTALAVELCARAVLPPPNEDESPAPDEVIGPPISSPNDWTPETSPNEYRQGRDEAALEKPGFGMGFRNKAAGSQKPADDEASTSSGIAGMRALWRKGRKNFEQQRKGAVGPSGQSEMEAATAAAAVARFLVGGSSGENAIDSSDHSAKSKRGDSYGEDEDSLPSFQRVRNRQIFGENVALMTPPDKKKQKIEMTEDLRLRSLVIPLTRLPLEKATSGGEAARVEQWYQMDGSNNMQSSLQWQSQRGPSLQRRNPSILLEITFSPPEVLDKEDEMHKESAEEKGGWAGERNSVSGGLGVIQEDDVATPQPKTPTAEVKPEDPVLEPGVVDFICVVGAKDIGDQRNDNGAKGWVNSTPEYAVLERFPPTDDFHINNGRMTGLPDKVEWFCFPEGCKLWRGAYPPTHNDLKLQRFSAAAQPNAASSMAAFDACLNCTTSFTWWLLASNSDEYGSSMNKTYGACIRFYAPAPPGIDPTQDDFAQSFLAGEAGAARKRTGSTAKRLWVPLAICLVSQLPIVGVMESMLLRICEQLSSRGGGVHAGTTPRNIMNIIHQDLANLIANFQKPIPGVLHCSIPFLQGERLHLTLPPPFGLPPLPHGAAVTMVCRLLGAEGLNVLLAAVLTECKILIHSDDVANLGMVAEVITALIYPFDWALPYIPVLPDTMLEFVEAPLSYFLGIPSHNLKMIDPSVLSDVVVVDLDNGFSSPDYFDGRRTGRPTKVPTSLPASVASNISKAVFRLLREEEEVEEQYGNVNFPGSRSLPRLESESLAEREFRIAVALQICGLVRGYQECLIFVSASQPVFNRDRFLRNAPALFEDRRGNLPAFANPVDSASGSMGGSQRMLSPRSKRFLSLLVNTQHFHGLLDRLGFDDIAFFHEVMDTFDMSDDQGDTRSSAGMIGGYGTSKLDVAASHLSRALQKVEDKIPTYRVDRKGKRRKGRGGGDGWENTYDNGMQAFENFLDGNESVCFGNDTLISSFTSDLLQQIFANEHKGDDDDSVGSGNGGVHSLSIEYMVKLEKNPWRYRKLFDIPLGEEVAEKPGQKGPKQKAKQASIVEIRDKVKLRDAIGERRYRAWKVAQDEKLDGGDDATVVSAMDSSSPEGQNALDLSSLLTSATADMSDTSSLTSASSDLSFNSNRGASGLSPEQQRVKDAKDREILRRCLERAYDGASNRVSRSTRKPGGSSDRDLISEAETALRNPSAQRFLVSVLSQRSRIEDRKKKRFSHEDAMKGSRHHRQTNQSSVSRLQPVSFECLVRLCCAMLDSCMEEKDYLPAYRLLTETAGFCTVRSGDGENKKTSPTKEGDDADSSKVIYMTARIGLHPIFADLRLWETVLALHLQDRQNEKGGGRGGNSGVSTPTDSLSGSGTSNKIPSEMLGNMGGGKAAGEAAEYEAAVATLYEMLGFGIPAEELARFANRVSEKYGWFTSERGHSFLMLARRLSVRRDEAEDDIGGAEDLNMLGARGKQDKKRLGGGVMVSKMKWAEVGWSHPAASSRPSPNHRDGPGTPRTGSPTRSRRSGGYESLVESEGFDNGASHDRRGSGGDAASKYLTRTAVTSTASFGSSVVASGGIDGSVFLAHTIKFGPDERGQEIEPVVRGVRLEWDADSGRSAETPDGEAGMGAISCLAAAKGAGFRPGNLLKSGRSEEEEMLALMEGCRLVAGTTSGDLRVWSVKEVYAATANFSDPDTAAAHLAEMRINHGHGRSGPSSSYVSPRSGSQEVMYSLQGRSLSGHRGGVSCMDVPSHVYRPDTLVTGGVDGLVKLWSLRKPSKRRNSGDTSSPPGRIFGRNSLGSPGGVDMSQGLGKEGGDANDSLGVMTGHGGRVTCVRTAWHGDRLISGGADKTVRCWDLAGTGGKCLNTLSGHTGWVTQTHYWGPHTVVSASTDRSVVLWDVRSHNSPLFVLRYHRSPISDVLVGSRTDPLIVSAGGDGTIATWDLRTLSGKDGDSNEDTKQSKLIRKPLATMKHCAESKNVRCSGGVLLSRGSGAQNSSAISVGMDAVMKEWDIATGKLFRQEPTGHCDIVSSLSSFSDVQRSASSSPSDSNADGSSTFGGTITSSWDGTIRMRRLIRK